MRRGLVIAALVALIAGTATAAGPFPGTKTVKDRAAWRAILHWPASCEREWQTMDLGFSGIGVWRTGTRRLVTVSCFLGAYQGVQMLYLVDAGKKATGLALHIYSDPGTGKPKPIYDRQILGLVDFTPRTGRLVVYDKFRGLGDCGILSTFRLAGSKFVPVEVRAKLACDGKGGGGPARWPKLPTPSP